MNNLYSTENQQMNQGALPLRSPGYESYERRLAKVT